MKKGRAKGKFTFFSLREWRNKVHRRRVENLHFKPRVNEHRFSFSTAQKNELMNLWTSPVFTSPVFTESIFIDFSMGTSLG